MALMLSAVSHQNARNSVQKPGILLEEFKARLPLADVVARYVKLTRQGRELKGLCPFHKENTPSFSVVEDKNFYHCFGCGAHGNAIDFVMAIERLEFPDAIRRVSEITGIEAPLPQRSEHQDPKIKGIAEANQAATQWFQAMLSGEPGGKARDYLRKRSLTFEHISLFELGYAPSGRQGLISYLEAQGFARDLTVEAGLASQLDDGTIIDRFRDRLMFPIVDERKRYAGFGGRTLGDAKAKYLNTAETPLFHKGDQLYGLNLVAADARKQNRIIVAEGYMDVIAFHRAGIGLAVAPLGTAVTEEQITKLWRYADEPVFCLDGDTAGKAAAVRAAKRALPVLRAGKSLQFATLPDGEDPDSLLDGAGPKRLREIIERPSTMIDVLFQAETAVNPGDTPERRAQIKKQLNMIAAGIADGDIRSQYQAMFRERTDSLWVPAFKGKKPFKKAKRPSLLSVHDAAMDDASRIVELDLLRPLLREPSFFSHIEEEFIEIEFQQPDLNALKSEILEFFSQLDASDGVDETTLRNHLNSHGFGQTLKETVDTRLGGWSMPVEVQHRSTLERWQANVARWRTAQQRRIEGEALLDDLLDSDETTANARIKSLRRLIDDDGSDGE